jgi:hypothetical protein
MALQHHTSETAKPNVARLHPLVFILILPPPVGTARSFKVSGLARKVPNVSLNFVFKPSFLTVIVTTTADSLRQGDALCPEPISWDSSTIFLALFFCMDLLYSAYLGPSIWGLRQFRLFPHSWRNWKKCGMRDTNTSAKIQHYLRQCQCCISRASLMPD